MPCVLRAPISGPLRTAGSLLAAALLCFRRRTLPVLSALELSDYYGASNETFPKDDNCQQQYSLKYKLMESLSLRV